MGRPEKPLDANGPVAEFAHDLRALRKRAGNPSYRELARTALFAASVLSSAASGHRLPTLPVTLGFVAACGGDTEAWERRWRQLAARLGVAAEPEAAGPPAEVRAVPQVVPHQVPPAPLRPAQLPMGAARFVGRGGELAEAVRVVRGAGRARTPLVISGPIGAGKTAVALQLAEQLAADFPDGQLYADLGAGDPSDDEVIRGFLPALGVPPAVLADATVQRVGLFRSLLTRRRLLVLLDNVRDEAQVRPLLGRTTQSQVIVTSRARLLGLDGTHRIDLEALPRPDSLALLAALAGADRLALEPGTADELADLCGDLPLAINILGRMIAARPEWSIAYTAELLAEPERLMDTLTVGDVSVRERFAREYQRLAPAARQALHQLGADGARWTTAICLAASLGVPVDAADQLLEALVDAGLLTRATVAGRYGVSRLVRAFAADLHHDASHVAVQLVDHRARRGRVGSVTDRASSAH
jgi:hypothetical protein